MASGKAGFAVHFGDGLSARFAALAGPESEGLVADYRHGNSPVFYPIKMPGLGRVGNVTLRKGIFTGDTRPLKAALASKAKRPVRIDVLDDAGKAASTWTLNNAWPTESGALGTSEGNEVAIESLEIAFETMTISAP